MDTFINKFGEYGIIGLVIGILFFLLWKILIWVMSFVKDIQKQQSEERTVWLCTLKTQSDTLIKISNSIEKHDEKADERGQHIREEHEKMMNCLDEQTRVLVQINGYKA